MRDLASWMWAAAALLPAFTAFAAERPAPPRLAVNVAPSCKGASSGPVLEVTVRLESPDPVITSRSALPWGARYNDFLVIAAPVDSTGDVLAVVSAFEEPIDSPEVRLSPGEVLSGEVPFNWRVEGAEQVLQKKALLVFWSYQLRTQDAGVSDRVGGWAPLQPCR